MSASKRRNLNAQMRKEDYEDEEDASEDAGSFARAPTEVLKKRRIVNVSSRFKVASPKEERAPLAANPFASIALAPSSTAASTSDDDALGRCNDAFLKWLRRQQQRAPASDWSKGIEDYLKAVAPLKKKAKPKQQSFAAAPGSIFAAEKTLFGGKTSSEKTEKTQQQQPKNDAPPPPPPPPKSSPFSFSAAAAPPAASAFSFGSVFGGGASKATSFPVSAPAAPAPAPKEEEDAMPLEAPSEVLKAEDANESTLFESRASVKRLDDRTWRDLGKGTARLTEHKQTKQRRVVIRNDVGKVTMNFKIDPKMTFNKAKSGLTFQAIADVDLGLKTYMLRTKEPLSQDLLKPAKFQE